MTWIQWALQNCFLDGILEVAAMFMLCCFVSQSFCKFIKSFTLLDSDFYSPYSFCSCLYWLGSICFTTAIWNQCYILFLFNCIQTCRSILKLGKCFCWDREFGRYVLECLLQHPSVEYMLIACLYLHIGSPQSIFFLTLSFEQLWVAKPDSHYWPLF